MPASKAVKTRVTLRRSRFSSPAIPRAAARVKVSRASGSKRPAAISTWRTLSGVSQLSRVRRISDRTFDSVGFNLCLCTIDDPERAVREALRVARPGAPMVFLEHVRSNVLPVALLQEALSPLLVAMEQDHCNRRTEETIRRAGVEVVSVERFAWGFFNLIVGRAPGA